MNPDTSNEEETLLTIHTIAGRAYFEGDQHPIGKPEATYLVRVPPDTELIELFDALRPDSKLHAAKIRYGPSPQQSFPCDADWLLAIARNHPATGIALVATII